MCMHIYRCMYVYIFSICTYMYVFRFVNLLVTIIDIVLNSITIYENNCQADLFILLLLNYNSSYAAGILYNTRIIGVFLTFYNCIYLNNGKFSFRQSSSLVYNIWNTTLVWIIILLWTDIMFTMILFLFYDISSQTIPTLSCM